MTPPTLTVADLLPTDQVSISGLSFDLVVPHIFISKTYGIRIDNCDGRVVLSDLRVERGASPGTTGGAVTVTNSGQVLFSSCEFEGFMTMPSFQYPGNQSAVTPGLYVSNSSVTVNNCSIKGASGFFGSFFTPQDQSSSGPAIWADTSTVRVSRSTLVGGNGGAFSDLFGAHVTDAGPALAALDSNVYVRGAVSDLLGGAGQFLTASSTGLGAPAIAIYGSTLMTITSDVQVAAGANGVGGTTTSLLFATGPFHFSPIGEPLASMEITPSTVTLGNNLTLDLAGPPSAPFLGYFSFGLGDSFKVQGLLGAVVLDLNAYAALPPQVLDGAGHRQLHLTIPALPSLVGSSIFAQGITASGQGTLSISAPTMVSIR